MKTRMTILFTLVIVAIILIVTIPERTKVAHIIDGDTFTTTSGQVIRLAGIDTPEFDECYGDEATAFLHEIMPEGSDVKLKGNKVDKYGRRIAWVKNKTHKVNYALLSNGYAEAYYLTEGKKWYAVHGMEAYAQDLNRGLWVACPPYKWQAGE